MFGNTSSNRLDGGAGTDTLTGGQGNDTYVVDNVNDQVVEAAGEGDDLVESSINYTLGDTLENLTLLGSADLDGTGNAGDNQLDGNAGNNRLDGVGGADTFRGGQGNDVYIVDSASDHVFEQVDQGDDTVQRHYDTNLVLANHVENLVLAAGIETGNGNALNNVVTGNGTNNALGGWAGADVLHGLGGDDALFGGADADDLHGGDGQDYLDGGAGIDTLAGGQGDDTYVVDDANDGVTELAGEGTDAVQATSSFVLSGHVENLFLMAASGAIDGTGNAMDNYLAGNDADNVLSGQAGNDTLVAGKGNNTLDGGTGDDKYVIDSASQGNVIDTGDGGFDGAFFNDGITADRLGFAQDGDDLLIFVDDANTPAVRVTNHFLGGEAAIDYVQPDGGYYLTTQQINQIVAANQSGGTYDQVVEGTASGEQLVGSAGKDLVKGLAGDDTLFGMGGDDALQGGDGNDYLSGGNGSFSGSGNDILIGDAGVDTLVGEDGADTLMGGVGNDKYLWQAGSDMDVINNTDGGTDWLFFNGVDPNRLAWHRDGDDLVIMVDNDPGQGVRVQDHFLGGDMAIDYVQPGSGYAIPESQMDALLTPMPSAAATQSLVATSTDEPGQVWPSAGIAGNGNPSMVRHLDVSQRDSLYRRGHALHGQDLIEADGPASRPAASAEMTAKWLDKPSVEAVSPAVLEYVPVTPPMNKAFESNAQKRMEPDSFVPAGNDVAMELQLVRLVESMASFGPGAAASLALEGMDDRIEARPLLTGTDGYLASYRGHSMFGL